MGILHHRHGAHGRHICDLRNLAAISCISVVRVKGLMLALLPVQTVFFSTRVQHMSQSNKLGKSSGKKNIETRLLHMGSDPRQYHGFVNTPLYRGSTILYPTLESFLSRTPQYTYGRRGTPTISALETAITELEGGYHGAYIIGSGSLCGKFAGLGEFRRARTHH